jgi:hypothetical protein
MAIPGDRRPGHFDAHSCLAILLCVFWVLVLLPTYAIISQMFLDSTKDTTILSNAVLAILGLFAGLSFSWSRALDAPEETRGKIVMAGEGLFAAAILFSGASLNKYALVGLLKHPPRNPDPNNQAFWISVYGYASAICFTLATVIALVSLIGISFLLLHGRFRDKAGES